MTSTPSDPAPAAYTPAPLTDAQRLGNTRLSPTAGKPAINVDDPNPANIARAMVENLPPYLIFRRDEDYFTVRQSPQPDAAGTYPAVTRGMSAKRLCSWAADYLRFERGTGEKAKPVSLSKDLAEKVLASDPWYDLTPEIELILPVRLPIWGARTESGTRTVTLAKPGYDPARKIYTVETLNYTTGARTYSPQGLRRAWDNLMRTFPWAAEQRGEADQLWKLGEETIQGPRPSRNRSACACLALMLGQYCRLLVDDLMPIGIINANQQGSGKSLLAWLCVTPVWGMAAGTACPRNDEEMIKSIHAAMRARSPYHMLDDIPVLNNSTLNMVATSNEVTGRLLGGLDTFTVKNNMQIFATGNALGTSADVERRSLICDLFMAEDAMERSFPSILTKKSISQPAWRADLLRFMQSMVENWSTAGCPELVSGNAKPTFESYATIIGSIMVCNGFMSPFTKREYEGAGGDLIGRTILRMLAHIVSNCMDGLKVRRFTVKEIIEISDTMEWTQTITSGSKSVHHSMGKRLEKYRNRTLTDETGRRFQFGKNEESGQSAYTFTIFDA